MYSFPTFSAEKNIQYFRFTVFLKMYEIVICTIVHISYKIIDHIQMVEKHKSNIS